MPSHLTGSAWKRNWEVAASLLTFTFTSGFLLFLRLQCQTTAVPSTQQHPPSSHRLWYHGRVEGCVACKPPDPHTLMLGACSLESWTGRFTLLAVCIVLRFCRSGASLLRRELLRNDLLHVLSLHLSHV